MARRWADGPGSAGLGAARWLAVRLLFAAWVVLVAAVPVGAEPLEADPPSADVFGAETGGAPAEEPGPAAEGPSVDDPGEAPAEPLVPDAEPGLGADPSPDDATDAPPVDGTEADDADGTGQRYIVRFVEGADPHRTAARLDAGEAEVEAVFQHGLNGAVVTLDPSTAETLRADPAVLDLEEDRDVPIPAPDPQGTLAGVTVQDDPPWGLDRIDQRDLPLSRSFAYSGDGGGVLVYVVDSGIEAAHRDFEGRVRPGFSVVPGFAPRADCVGHGTHVAGTVAGRVHGVAKAATLVPVRITATCTGDPSFSVSDLLIGLQWVHDTHPRGTPGVVNLSLAVRGGSRAVDDMARGLVQRGLTVVAAAGNWGDADCRTSPPQGPSPARVAEVLTVGAMGVVPSPAGPRDERPPWSSHGQCIDLFAPGVDIVSTSNTDTRASVIDSGTSMAAPHVAGAAAVVLGRNPGWSPQQVADRLIGDATPDLVVGAFVGSPNRLLYLAPDADPSCDWTDGWIPGRRPADDQVSRLYRAAFGRPPEPSGLSYWLDRQVDGLALGAMAEEFTRAPEWQLRYGPAPSAEALVDALYRNVLGRPGDPAGRAYWIGRLRAGASTSSVLTGFSESAENVDRTGTMPTPSRPAGEVYRLYQAVFDRLPDSCGFAYWVGLRRAGTSLDAVAGSFTRSAEWQQRFGARPTPEALVDALYRNVLGRAGDPSGRAFWVGRLRAGASTSSVLVGFSESAENLRRTGTLR
jgi:subtilisin family serine protease